MADSDIDLTAAKRLDRLVQDYPTAIKFLAFYKKATGNTLSESALCKMRAGQSRVHPGLKVFVSIMETPYGSVFFVDGDDNAILRSLWLSLSHGRYADVIEMSTLYIRFFQVGALTPTDIPKSLVPKLYAFHAVALGSQERFQEAEAEYIKAATLAAEVAPLIASRYRMSALNFRLDRLHLGFKAETVSLAKWELELRAALKELESIVIEDPEHEDATLRVRSLLRTTSRLGELKPFLYWLNFARANPFSGFNDVNTDALAKDRYLKQWMSNDENKEDFANALGWIATLQDLRDMR